MPEITVTHIALLAIALLVGTVLGWVGRGSRTQGEKAAINEGWQEQLDVQLNEHERLLDRNRSLMEQNSQYQASNNDAKMRASELSSALKEAFERRDELQRQIKGIRGNLESAVTQRDQLQSDIQDQASRGDSTTVLMEEKDRQIEKLGRELGNWQNRLPPLIERFRKRNAEAEELEQDLDAARQHIAALEAMVGSEQTLVEAVNPDALPDGMEASNDPIDGETVEVDVEEGRQDSEDKNEEAEDDDEPEDGENPDDDRDDPEENRGAQDDLKLIKGIGPAIEKTLMEMGIRHFNQIAEMSEYDIDRVAHRLKGFRSRIYREDWIGQARDLHDQKVSGQQ